MALSTAWCSDPSSDLNAFAAVIAPMYTSFGDMTRLGIMERFRPAHGNASLVVEDLDYANRFEMPPNANCFFEYDGRFRVVCVIGARHTTQAKMDFYLRLVKEWFDAVV